MRISDWSSDVCSSDLRHRMLLGREAEQPGTVAEAHGVGGHHLGVQQRAPRQVTVERPAMPVGPIHHRGDAEATGEVVHASDLRRIGRSEEHTSELQSLMRISYAVFCLKKKKNETTERKKYS